MGAEVSVELEALGISWRLVEQVSKIPLDAVVDGSFDRFLPSELNEIRRDR